ncbi:sel1 repeat family protein [Streptomyces cyaneochromogenes]|uniref:Sel1 repeat family protein n=1 Tax=Streptomyces cyaneochromogenes TaxID=2496836 RepID=A0A3Q9EN35_9ACTN|nr:sel1 repeat family protein [Streptomyces cyaneochromogenes]AZQ35268.1 sel1 repeat family protein [Streptomyces cyaneochromogenes]
MATESELLRDALLLAVKSSPTARQRVGQLLESSGFSRAARAVRSQNRWNTASLLLTSLDALRARHPGRIADLQAIAEEYAPDSTGTDTTGAADRPRPVVPGDSTGGAHVAGDHVDFRDGTFHDQVVGVQHNHFAAVHVPAQWRQVRQVGPLEFGVQPTRHVPGLPRVPPYVQRDCDKALRAMLARNGLVLILGEPCAGKSYTAWHGVQSLEDRRLYAPVAGEDLRPLVAPLRGSSGKYVLWLDELTGHLGARGLDPSLLWGLIDGGAVLLGTMSPTEYYRRRTGTAPGDRVVAAARTVELAREWSEAELARLAALDDPRAYPAYVWSGREGVASYFAVGHHLYDEWRRVGTQLEHPRGQLLVRAAVDLARCGVTGAVPTDLLRRIQEKYRAEERQSFEDALAWATEPLFGVSGLLVSGEKDGTWRAYGALVAEALRSGALEPVPDEVWWTLLDTSEASASIDRDAVLDAARAALHPRLEQDTALMIAFASRVGADERRELLHRAADAGDATAAEDLAAILLKAGDEAAALPYLEMAAESGSGGAAREAGRLYLGRAEKWLRIGSKKGDPDAARLLGDLLLGRGDLDEADDSYLTAEKHGYAEVARSSGVYHLLVNGREAAEVWLTRAADAGDERAAELLEDARRAPQSVSDAEDYFATTSTYPLDHTHYGVVMEKQGRLREARTSYEKGYKIGDAYGAYRLAALLEQEGRPDEAADWYRRAADMGHPGARKALSETSGRPDTVKE